MYWSPSRTGTRRASTGPAKARLRQAAGLSIAFLHVNRDCFFVAACHFYDEFELFKIDE
jgi:hypothetical protein